MKRYFAPGILFYEGIFILITSTLFLSIVYSRLTKNINIKVHRIYILIISFFSILTFHTTVLTIVDRSISVSIISNIHHGVNTNTTIKQEFIERFVKKGIDKRIKEQVQIGNMMQKEDELFLTWKGDLYYNIFKYIQLIFNTDAHIIKII